MFPLSLAAGPLSLGKGSCALSIGCVVNGGTGELQWDDVEVVPSTVDVERLTYAQVDATLLGEACGGGEADGEAFEALQTLSR